MAELVIPISIIMYFLSILNLLFIIPNSYVTHIEKSLLENVTILFSKAHLKETRRQSFL